MPRKPARRSRKSSPSTNGSTHVGPSLNGDSLGPAHDVHPAAGFMDPIAANNIASAVNNVTSRSWASDLSSMGDPRRSVDDECGYPPQDQGVSVEIFKRLYDRCDVANRAVQLMPKECWKAPPTVYETKEVENVTPFEADWDALGASLGVGRSWHAEEAGSMVWDYLSRADSLSRIGAYGVLLIGFDDGKNLQEPLDGLVTVNWKEETVYATRERLVPTLGTNAAGQTVKVLRMRKVRVPVGVRRHSPTYRPIMPDSPASPQEVDALRNPRTRKVWNRWDAKSRKHVYDEVRAPAMNEQEQMTVNRWAAERTVGSHVKRLLQEGRLVEAVQVVDNAKHADGELVGWQRMGLTVNERTSLAQAKHQLTLNAAANPLPPRRVDPDDVLPPAPPTFPRGPQTSLVDPRRAQPNAGNPNVPSPAKSAAEQSAPGTRAPSRPPGDDDAVSAASLSPQRSVPPFFHPQDTSSAPQQPGRRPSNVRADGGPTGALEPNSSFPPSTQPSYSSDRKPGDVHQGGSSNPVKGPPHRPGPDGFPNASPPGKTPTQVYGTDRQYGTSDPAMSAGFGMSPAQYPHSSPPGSGSGSGSVNDHGDNTNKLGLGSVHGGSMAGTEQQYYGVQLGPTEYPSPQPPAQRRKVIFMRPYDESLVQVVRYEWNVNNPRFGMPVMYRITLNDPREVHSGIGLPLATVFVHWSRVIHFADVHANAGASEIFAPPVLRPILNRCLDLYKLPAAAAEGYWQSGTPTRVFETHPQLGGDVLFDESAARDQIEQLVNSLQKVLFGRGGSWKLLGPSMVDPSPFIQTQIELICIQLGCPVRIFKGAERGELASSQDDANWNSRVTGRQNGYLTPRVICPFVDRLIAAGALSQPEVYYVEWPDLESLSIKDKAAIFQQLVAAVAAYIQAGAQSLVPPKELLTKFTAGLFDEEEVDAILEAAAVEEENMMQKQMDQMGMQSELMGQQHAMLDQDITGRKAIAEKHGFDVEAPEGFTDVEQEEHQRGVEEKLAEKGVAMPGGSAFGDVGGGFPGGPGKGGPPGGAPPFGGNPKGGQPGGKPFGGGGGKGSPQFGGKQGGGGAGPVVGGPPGAPPPNPFASAPKKDQPGTGRPPFGTPAMSSPKPGQPNAGEPAPAIAGRGKQPFVKNEEDLTDLVDNFDPDQPRDDGGRWSSGGGSSVERVKSAVAKVSEFGRSLEDMRGDHGLADHAVKELGSLSKEDLRRTLADAGVEGLRPGDSKKALLQKLHNRLTAGVRARERSEV